MLYFREFHGQVSKCECNGCKYSGLYLLVTLFQRPWIARSKGTKHICCQKSQNKRATKI